MTAKTPRTASLWQRSSLTSRWSPRSVPAAAASAWMVRICQPCRCYSRRVRSAHT